MMRRRSLAMGFLGILVWILALFLSGANSHRLLGSLKPAMNSFTKWSMRPQGSGDATAVRKFISRHEAEKLLIARGKNVEHYQKSQAPAPSPFAKAVSPSPSMATNDSDKVPAKSRIFYATEYGADPTGGADSSGALMAAISDAFSIKTDKALMPGVVDLGGAEIHLQGGNYLLSSPLRMPGGGGGNFVIHGGTLRASDDFPKDRFLIELWSAGSQKMNTSLAGVELFDAVLAANDDQTASYEDIALRDLNLDANFRGGGILVVHSVRTTIDNCYISHFGTYGIQVQKGHETYIRNSFLGQHITAGGSHNERDFGGVGISLMGNDNALTDVVIFSADVGIEVTGQANIFIGVHCYNKATSFGGVGMKLRLPGLTQTRIIGCYMDYTAIVAEDPVQLDISNSFFLGDAAIKLKATSKKTIQGLNIVDNMFSGSGKGVDIVQLDGKFDIVRQIVVDRNNVRGMTLKSTVARATVKGNGTRWTVDFSPFLLIPDHIQHVQYSFYTPEESSSFPRHALRNVSNNKVVIEADSPVSATVSVMVDQSATFVSGQGIYS